LTLEKNWKTWFAPLKKIVWALVASGNLPSLWTPKYATGWTHEMTPAAVIFPEFPCHTQAVQWHMKLVTEVAKVVCGQKSRDGFIRARVSSRQLIPTFESKCDFSHFTLWPLWRSNREIRQ
jgi:hypothetical protein